MKKSAIFFLVLCGLIFIRFAVMLTTPVFEPSEARYAAISANMARTGEWFVPQFTYKGTYQHFAGKPPLVFQASALCCKIFGISELAVRLVPFLSFLVLLAIVYYTVRAGDSISSARLATGICASSVALFATAGFCMMDSSLTCCVSGALLLYWRFIQMPISPTRIIIIVLMGILLALGMLIKGPVSLALFFLPVGAEMITNKRWSRKLIFEFLFLIVVIAVIVVPYFWTVEQHQPGFLKYFFINENLMRFLVQEYGDKYGAGRETFRGMAVIWTWVVMLPWSLLPIYKFKIFKFRIHSVVRCFPLLAATVIILFWCLTSRVPLAYLLPIVPLIAVAIAINEEKLRENGVALGRLLPWAALISSIVLIIALIGVMIFNPKKMPGSSAPPKIRGSYYSYEFYHHPWGKGSVGQ